MKREVTQMDLDMPQLQQLVLKNTERIDKNELMIKQMRKESMEQARKSAERDEWLENSRREHDRWARSMRETLDEIAQYSKQSQIEQEMRSLELDARFAETDRQLKETDRQLKETDRQLKETDQQLKETSLEVKRLSHQLSGTTGHIVEGLVSSSTEKLFEKAGLVLHNSGKNLKRSLPSENIAMEVDVLLSNEELAIPIEVKANCTKDNVRRFLHQMNHFRRLFPEYDGKEVVAAIAAINYEKGVAELAHREKLLVIRVNSDDIFSIDPFQKDELRKF
ncbi:MAG: hypothetical protein IKO81_00965 [Bacteroidales bacterium]|nr:hypothetical protein [Bacteroidales bacterium]